MATPLLKPAPSEPSRPAGPVAGARRLRDRVLVLVLARPRAVLASGAVAVVAAMACMFLLHLAGTGHGAGVDYQVYRWAVRTWLGGGDPSQGAAMTSADRPLPWVYPPFALLPLAVPSVLPFVPGLWLLYLTDLAALGGVLYLVVRSMWPVAGRSGAAAAASLGLAGTLLLEPVYASFGLGQVNILLMGLVAADCLTARPRWPRGLLVGLAAAIKLTPAAFVLFFLFRRDFRAAVVAAVTAVAGTACGFLVSFPASMDYWFGRGPAAGVSGSAYHTNQSIMGELARLELPTGVRYAVWAVLALALLVVTARVLRTAEAPQALLANGLLALLISPTSWSDHWVWAAPGVLVALATAVRRRSIGWAVSGAAIVVAAHIAPFRMLPAAGDWNAIQHVVGNSYLLLGIAMLLLLERDLRRRRRSPRFLAETTAAVR